MVLKKLSIENGTTSELQRLCECHNDCINVFLKNFENFEKKIGKSNTAISVRLRVKNDWSGHQVFPA